MPGPPNTYVDLGGSYSAGQCRLHEALDYANSAQRLPSVSDAKHVEELAGVPERFSTVEHITKQAMGCEQGTGKICGRSRGQAMWSTRCAHAVQPQLHQGCCPQGAQDCWVRGQALKVSGRHMRTWYFGLAAWHYGCGEWPKGLEPFESEFARGAWQGGDRKAWRNQMVALLLSDPGAVRRRRMLYAVCLQPILLYDPSDPR